MTFEDYAAAGFGEDLLPILPPDAQVNPESEAYDNLMAARGKVPGRLSKEGWFGFGGWSTHISTTINHKQWANWSCGIGIQGRNFPAVDIDVDREDLSNEILREATLTLGMAPVRTGRAGRVLLVYAGAGIRKRRLVFRIPRGPSGPAADVGGGSPGAPEAGRVLGDVPAGAEGDWDTFAVEVLGEGQQYIIGGIHPKTGAPYGWREGATLLGFGAAGLTPVTADEIDEFISRVAELVVSPAWGGQIVGNDGAGRSGGLRDGAPQGGLRAPSLEAVREALSVIENDVDYDEWIRIAAAVKAATEGLEA